MKWIPLLALAATPYLLIGGGPSIAAAPAVPPQGVVETYSAMSQVQSERLRGASMEVEIDASLPKLQKKGRLHALRHISKLGRITYEALRFEGDNTVKQNVIARYLSAEVQAQASDNALMAVTPANYKFKYRGPISNEGRLIHVFQLTPRKKRVGLFKGELWLDAQTCLSVRESGRLVKSPSIFVRRIDFIRDYEIRDGLAIPRRMETVIDTRLVGKAELSVEFTHVLLAESQVVSIAAGTGR